MGNINSNGYYRAFKTDLRRLVLTKIKKENNCMICKVHLSKGSVCLCKTYSYCSSKICLDCAMKFLFNFIKSVETFKDVGRKTLMDIKKNKKKYELINYSARI